VTTSGPTSSGSRWTRLAAAVSSRTARPEDPDRDWKARIRAAGALAIARALPELFTVTRDGRFGPCPSCGAARTSGDARPVLFERPSSKDGAPVWTCRVCHRTDNAVEFVILAARNGQPPHTSEEWAEVRRWLASHGIVAPDPFDRSGPSVAAVPLRQLEREPEVPVVPPPAVDEVRAFWSACGPVVEPELVAVLGLAAPPSPALARVQPGGGPPGGWPAWCPPELTTDRRVVLPLVNADGRCRSLAFVWTHPEPAAPSPDPFLATGRPVWWRSDLESPLDAALVAARAGLRVLPLHGVADGVCTCSDGATCARAGKHPRIRDWSTRASSDEGTIRGWWATWPDANAGIATGDGLVVVDVDGPEGEATLARLELEHGPLPVTLEVRSGREGGGRHLYLSAPGWHVPTSRASERARQGTDPLGPKLDIRADGGNGLVVAPGSMHGTGRRYRVVAVDNWLRPAPEGEAPVTCAPIAAAPRWLLDAAGAERRLALPEGTGAAGLCLASPAARAWLTTSGPSDLRLVVVAPAAFLAAVERRPDAAVVGAADDGWTREWADRVPEGARVVVARSTGLVERIEHMARGRYRVEGR
jgi:hypothetical protein